MADNPFNAFLDPSKQGTISGMIGGMMGNPTASQATGSATGSALQELSALKSQGMDNQQALLKFFQTPSGQDFFTNAGPDGLKSLVDGLTATTAPAATMHNVPEGAQLYSTSPNVNGGQPQLAASNPKSYPPTVLPPQNQMFDRSGNQIAENTNQAANDEPADVKSFKYFSNIGKLPSDEVKRLAGLRADPTKGGPNSVMSEAVDNLTSKYGLDARTAEAIKAGTLKIIPLKNELGQDTGDITVYDLSNPAAGAQMIKAKRAEGAPPVGSTPTAAPGTSPDTGAATGVLPPTPITPDPTRASSIPQNNPAYFGSKSSMFLASGPIAKGLAGASGVSEMVNPKMIIPEGAQAADRQTQIDTLRSDLAAMGQLGGGIGVNKGVLEGYLKLAPSGGITESPHQAIQKAIRLSEHVQQEIDAQSSVYNDARLPMEQRKGAQALIQGWQRVQRDLPTPDELTKMEKAIREGTAGAPTISGAANTVVNAAGKAMTEIKKEAGTVQKDQGLGTNQPNIDAINDPKELLAIDPRTLSREDKIKYLRKIDKITGGKRSDSGSFQVAGDVVPLHPPGTFARNTQSGDVINGMAKDLGVSNPNNVRQFPRRT